MTSPTATRIEPVPAGDRVALFDVLRGFALFGILLANFSAPEGTVLPQVDGAMEYLLDLLVWSSFYPLYSFLFGLGFAVQLLRAQGRGTVHLFLRRLLGLFLIGTFHAVLIWDGDILVDYALIGVWLIPLHRLPDRALLVVSLLFLALYVFEPPLTHAPRADDPGRQLAAGVRTEERQIAIGTGAPGPGAQTFVAAVEDRWRRFSSDVTDTFSLPRIFGGDILLAFLVGLYVGRRRLLHRAAEHRRGLAIVLGSALTVSTAANLYWHFDGDWGSAAENLIWLGSDFGLTVAYVAGIALLLSASGRWAGWLSRLAPAGRMGLTNYLAQSVVMTALFFPYALDLPDYGTTIRIAVHVVFFFLIQVPLSRWWLARYRYGPAEWLWRSMTYGSFQPFRLGAGDSTGSTASQPA